MRKLFVFLFISALVLSFSINAIAEQSATTQTGKRWEEQQVFSYFYNKTGADISSNHVVVLDITNATAGTTLGTCVATNATAGNTYIVGITDEVLVDGSVGRVCVKGPHRAIFTATPTAADRVSNGTTAGLCTTQTSTANKYGYIGTALAQVGSTDALYDYATSKVWWVWVSPTIQ